MSPCERLLAAVPADVEFFERKIRPVLVRQCYKCHSADAESVKGGLYLDHRAGLIEGGDNGPAIVPGRADQSRLIDAIRYDGKASSMPPDGKLPDSVIADFKRWVASGAADPRARNVTSVKSEIDVEAGREFWAFQPPQPVDVDTLFKSDWPRTTIDLLVFAGLKRQKLKPVGDASARVLIRRAYFDLIGLPPSPGDVDEFESAFARDRQAAIRQVVDRLLSSPRFGERWGRHWLDVVRFAESTGRSVNFPYNYAWRYRNYVIDSFNKDKSYVRFVREQIAGDLLPARDDEEANEHIIATGFLAIGPRELNYDDREAAKTERYFLHSVDEQIDVTSRGILALTVSCAQCHDHKFDPIPTTDYYALAGIFRSSESLVGYVHGLGNSGRYFPERLALLKGFQDAEYKTYEAYREDATAAWNTLKRVMTDLWTIRRQEGQVGFTNQMREKQEEVVKDHRKKLDDLAKELPPEMPVALGVVDRGQPADMHVYIAGDPESPGPLVRRGFLQVVGPSGPAVIPKDQSGRLQLAEWLVHRNNPLTARVMVNRIWHHLFGRGVVPTVDNFGATGQKPTNLRLLDYLALRFMEQGWSVKSMIREIVLSRVYQLASDHHAASYAIDPDNQSLWRMSRRRLEVEPLRDAMLAVSGQLDLSLPAGSPLMRSGAGQIRSSKDIPAPARTAGGKHRAVYQTLIRDMEPEMLGLFDFPSTSNVHGRRDTTTVATQALFFMNDPFVVKQARFAAQRALAERQLDREQRIELAYRLALGRRPSSEESQEAVAFLASERVGERRTEGSASRAGEVDASEPVEAWSRLFQTLFASAEFRYIE